MFESLDTYSVSLIVWLVLGGAISIWLLLDPRWADQPVDARRVSGILTATIGMLAALIVVFAPLYTRTTVGPNPSSDDPDAAMETTERISLWEQGLPPEFALMLAVFAGVLIVVGRCAVPHRREHSREAVALLWVAAVALLASALIAIMTVGLFLIPVATLALATALHATRARSDRDADADHHQELQQGGVRQDDYRAF